MQVFALLLWFFWLSSERRVKGETVTAWTENNIVVYILRLLKIL